VAQPEANALICSRCHAANKAGRRFCSGCGASLSLVCPECNFENTPDDQFCGGCGKALAPAPVPGQPKTEAPAREQLSRLMPKDLAAKISDTRGRVEGERRQVTVLFCDLADSTAIAERLEPEIYRELINDYIETSIRSVYRYEGVITEIAGDGFMAIFGAPVAHDDDAARACRAAIDIIANLRTLAAKWQSRVGRQVAGRIGLNSGPVVVGTVGNDLRMDYTAIGDTINVASRIQAHGKPDEIHLSDSTRRLIASRFETAELGHETFKGKTEETVVFRLAREVPRHERRHQALRSGLSRFCGRRGEITLLNEKFEQAREGNGHVVLLSGEAGIGKSRLIYEFRRQLDPSSYAWLEGQCMSYGTAAPYYPLLDLLRGAFQISESDSPEIVVEKVISFCRSAGGAVARAEPFYRDLLSVDPGDKRIEVMLPELKTSNYFEAFRDLMLTMSRERPVILLVEDIHWIDQSSEMLLRWLLDGIAGARVFAFLTHRPEYSWPHPVRSYFSRISLHGLPGSLVDELARSVLGPAHLSVSLKRLIAQRSDGNPFFVEELAKSIQEMGVTERKLSDAELAAAVPPTLQQVIMARIDRLDGEAKHALQVASVIGREFAVRILERAQEWKAPSKGSLEKLQSLELIYEKAAHPELAYMFKHALTHDVAYGTLLRAQQRDLHRRVAMLIEEMYSDRLPEFYETLAYQYRQAEITEPAARYALLSGERAASRLAPEAIRHFGDAIALSEGREDCGDIFVKAQAGLGNLMHLQGQVDQANEAYTKAIGIARDPQVLHSLSNQVVHRRFVERDGVKLAYYLQGEGAADPSAAPIVMFHPIIQGSFQFAPLAQRLCQDFPVVSMDPRGFGASDKPDRPYNFEDQVRDAVAVLEQIPHPKFILWGDSDGVPLAVHIFHELPDRVEKMIFFGGFARVRRAPDYPIGSSEQEVDALLKRYLTDDYRTGVATWVADAFSEPGLTAWREQLVEAFCSLITREMSKSFWHSVVERDDRALLPAVNVPTLLIAGEEDKLVPVRWVRYLADVIPGAQFAIIKRAGHQAPWTAADIFLEMLTTFIKTNTLPRTEWQA
jgi:class 3 adenylate cyclase/pimeloyl-ACP methyl ester carboxylesterase